MRFENVFSWLSQFSFQLVQDQVGDVIDESGVERGVLGQFVKEFDPDRMVEVTDEEEGDYAGVERGLFLTPGRTNDVQGLSIRVNDLADVTSAKAHHFPAQLTVQV